MHAAAFIEKWRRIELKERSASQSHFNDLCTVLGVPTPTEADPTGAFYAFERGAKKSGGGDGWADVWFRGHFAWEYKGQRADLRAAYRQLLQYREDLENPPLLVVCDLDRFEVHTNFTGTVKKVHTFSLTELDQPANLAVLRAVFTDPNALRPETTVESVTEEAAARFGALAAGLNARGVEPHAAAHYLVQLLFCLFAEDVELLSRGLFTRTLAYGARHPDRFPGQVRELLEAMRSGGSFALEDVPRFNGGLFQTVEVFPLTGQELGELSEAAALNWGGVEPAIFGTLFERSLDPSKRAQLGAHYTGRADIERVVEPVVLAPLRRRWDVVRAEADGLKAAWEAATTPQTRQNRRRSFEAALFAFQEELASVRILDPACGSGNFLYVALAKLLDLEKEVVTYGAANGLSVMLPRVGPGQLFGLELNEYARELAQVVVWIGYLQWMIGNGFPGRRDPVLEPLETIRLQDALLDRSDPEHPREAAWPEADFVIGNPPFLGAKKLRRELSGDYTEDLFRVFEDRLPGMSDLACYFFEKARAMIQKGSAQRAGLLATNSIRGGASRRVLDRIKDSGDIFMAWDDEPWVIDGAAVRISIVGFDDGTETLRTMDGVPVDTIMSSLSSRADIATAKRLPENRAIGFVADVKAGKFDVPGDLARRWLALPLNPNGRPNSDVVRPWVNGLDIIRRPRDMWIVDFGVAMPLEEAALYEAPFEHVRTYVLPDREKTRRAKYRNFWWIHAEPVSGMRRAIEPLARYIATPTVAKYRVFSWLTGNVLADHQLIVFARDDDYFFGVLHSRAHEVWSLRMGTSLEDRPRYTPTTCFETFPLPWPPGPEFEPGPDNPRVAAIATAAADLDATRRRWLDPPGATPEQLKKLTLTNLYNQRPTWLTHAHAAVDRAVWAAYGWDDPDPATVPEETILERLLALNGERAA